MRLKTTFLLSCASLLLLAVGCKQTTVSDRPPRAVRTANSDQLLPPPPGVTGSSSVVDMKDPCAARLHDVEGLLLQYYMINKRLPGTLDELKPLATIGQPTDFTCPNSKKPFVYLPQSPQMLSVDRVVVYAPEASADGKFRAIVMGIPRGNQAVAAAVVILTEPELQGQLAGAPAPAGSTSRPIR